MRCSGLEKKVGKHLKKEVALEGRKEDSAAYLVLDFQLVYK
jgi:hypothetical protein